MNDKTLAIIITAQDKASHVMSGVGDKMESVGNTIKKAAEVAAVALLAVGAAAVAYGVSASKAYAEVEAINAQLRHAVVDVTHATEAQLQATSDLADSLERKGVLDGDNIKLGLAQLSTFGLSNKAVQALGGSLADLAVNQFGVKASGEQLSDSANMIAKALNGQFGILEKSGIRFTEAQKATINFGTETEKVAALNAGFAQNLKYTNEVAKNTAEGGLARIKVQMGNVQEAIGKVINDGIVPYIAKSLEWFNSIGGVSGVMKTLGDTLKGVNDKLMPIIWAVGDYLTPKFTALWNTLSTQVIPILSTLWHDYIEPLLPVIGTLLVGAIGFVVDAFNAILKVAAPITQFLLDHKGAVELLAIAFGTLATSMMLGAAFDAVKVGFATMQLVTIPSMIATLSTLGAAMVAAFPFLVIMSGLVIMGQKILETRNLLSSLADQNARIQDSTQNARLQMIQLSRSGTADQKARANTALHNLGVPGYSTGGFTGSGSSSAIAGVVHKGEYVIPKSGVNQSTGEPMLGSTFNMYGSINLGDSSAVDRFFERINAQKELGSMGVGV